MKIYIISNDQWEEHAQNIYFPNDSLIQSFLLLLWTFIMILLQALKPLRNRGIIFILIIIYSVELTRKILSLSRKASRSCVKIKRSLGWNSVMTSIVNVGSCWATNSSCSIVSRAVDHSRVLALLASSVVPSAICVRVRL